LDFPVTVTIKPFEASRLKIRRSRHHLNGLDLAVREFLGRKPVEVVVENWAEAPEWLKSQAWTARIREHVPADFSAMVGDVVHNLRTSLDLLACDLVRLNGKVPNGVYFPFSGSAGDFDKIVRERRMDKASPEVLQILRSLKPYKGGNEMLRAIHDMDVSDKHKALIPVVHAATIPPLTLNIGGNITPIPQWDSYVTTDGHKMLIMPSMFNVPLGTVIPVSLRVVFGPEDVLAGHEILIALENLTQLADRIVNTFAALFPGQVPQKNDIGKV
jgi:hypothetical protein